MSKTIEGLPEFISYEQWLDMFAACGIEPRQVVELRMAQDGVHTLLFALDANGKRQVDLQHGGYYKHRVFIPIRREPGDARVTRVTPVQP